MDQARKNQINRINRQLQKKGHRLYVSSQREKSNMGGYDYHIVDLYKNAVIEYVDDLKSLELDLKSGMLIAE